MENQEVKIGCKKCGYPGHFSYEVSTDYLFNFFNYDVQFMQDYFKYDIMLVFLVSKPCEVGTKSRINIRCQVFLKFCLSAINSKPLLFKTSGYAPRCL